MMLRIFILLATVLVSAQTNAFTCFITLVKDDCWARYTTTVSVYDASTNKQLIQVIAPSVIPPQEAVSTWKRERFICQPGQKLRFAAQFYPTFWEGGEGKVYAALETWALPEQIGQRETAWNIPLYYPKQFSEVPMPPEQGSTCKYATDDIPSIPPQ